MKVEVIKLPVDGSMSIRADGQEVAILPPKWRCDEEDLEEAMQKLAMYVREEEGQW